MTLLLTAALFMPPAQAVPECAPGMIHYPPLCLTVAEHAALTGQPIAETPQRAFNPSASGVERWRAMVAYYWGKHGATDRMLRIADCESGGVPTVVNPRSGATGIFQIMPFWQRAWPGDYKDAWTNAAVAYQIWLTQGYRAWSCRG